MVTYKPGSVYAIALQSKGYVDSYSSAQIVTDLLLRPTSGPEWKRSVRINLKNPNLVLHRIGLAYA